MLHPLNSLILFTFIVVLGLPTVSFSRSYTNSEIQTTSCRISSSEEPARKQDFYQKFPALDNSLKTNELNEKSCHTADLQILQKDSMQKVEALQQDKKFQEIVAELQGKEPENARKIQDLSAENKAELLIFFSFSMGEKALLNLAHHAKRFGATLVLRGFKEGSYKKTAQALHKIILKTGQGILIDPELYTLFGITTVPTFVLTKPFQLNTGERTQTPVHDKLQGHVSTRYALEVITKEGNLKEEAHLILNRGETP